LIKTHKKTKMEKKKTPKVEKTLKPIENGCKDKNCPTHGGLKIRGRIFEGKVVRKHPKRIAIEFERMVYVRKYERYAKFKTRIHARLPECIEKEISVGDLIKIGECRPLSKMIHFVVLEKVNNKEKKK
jgi:small subunit ribosomal protein S17